MEHLLSRFKRDMVIRAYSPQTCRQYLRFCEDFLSRYPSDQINSETIKDYLYHLIEKKNLKQPSIRQAHASLKYFYTQTLGRSWEDLNLPSMRSKKKLPTFFTPKEILSILHSTESLRDKTMLALTYSSGLRASEICQLRLCDIKRDIKRLHIRQGKGNKDRYTILSDIGLKLLEKYWKQYRPKDFLFYGKSNKDKPLVTRSCQNIFWKAKHKSGVTTPGGIHTLRHSFATHFLEVGGNLLQLQKFMGHSNPKTTMIYTHVMKTSSNIISPLDYYVKIYC